MEDVLQYQIREQSFAPDPADAQFIMDAFDSTLPYLASIGSGVQWGLEALSRNEKFRRNIQEWTETSTSDGQPVRLFIAELSTRGLPTPGLHCRIDENGNEVLLIGAALVADSWVPPHITNAFKDLSLEFLSEILNDKNFLYIEVLTTDFRAGSGYPRKGAGAALINHIKEYGIKMGKETLLVDCWAGNERKLVR
jgi:hypothetical protein